MARVLGIFNFGLCKGGLTFGAPVNGFKALVNIALCCHFTENFNLLCDKFGF